ncbi:MAG: VOC family protein [Gammaproteobacteria bacterium]|nr:VOC family protein [Gammaproteobacteria bacterium]
MSGFKPEGWHTVTPRLFVRDPVALVEFLKLGFDASCTRPEGDAPAEVWIGDSVVMVSSDAVRAATTSVLYVYVKDVDLAYQRAIAAGATSIEEPNDLPYGDRRAAVTDGWGNTWQIATRLP